MPLPKEGTLTGASYSPLASFKEESDAILAKFAFAPAGTAELPEPGFKSAESTEAKPMKALIIAAGCVVFAAAVAGVTIAARKRKKKAG